MKKLGLGIVMAAMVFAGEAKTDEPVTVQKLLDMCNTPMGSAGTIYCVGYIAGVGSVMEANGIALSRFTLRDAHLLKEFSLCGDTTAGASIQAFKNWAQAHPEQWTQDANIGVIMALQQTWPCK